MNRSMRFLLVLILTIIGQVNMWGASSPTDVGNYINLKDGTYGGNGNGDKAKPLYKRNFRRRLQSRLHQEWLLVQL